MEQISCTPRTGDMAYGSQGSSIEVLDVLCQMLKQHLLLNVDMEVYDGNPLNLKYFMTMFKELEESKTEDPHERLAQLIKYTIREAINKVLL